jgi:hypothetical protein
MTRELGMHYVFNNEVQPDIVLQPATDPIITSRNFVQVPAGITRTRDCPSGLP